jgi:hypothetical protein
VVALRVRNNDRNLQVQLDPVGGLNATVQWAAAPPGPGPPTPVPPPPRLVRRATDGVVVARGALLYALRPQYGGAGWPHADPGLTALGFSALKLKYDEPPPQFAFYSTRAATPRSVTSTGPPFQPDRPKAVDRRVEATGPWNFALMLGGGGSGGGNGGRHPLSSSPGMGVIVNKHSTDVRSPPPLRVCIGIHHDAQSCSDLCRVLVLNDPRAWIPR